MSDDRVWGRNPVLALLRSGSRRADEVAVLAGARGPLSEVVALARRAGIKVSYRTRDQLTAIAGTAEDPRNFGALLRTADAFGVHGVVVPKHHAVGLTEAAARTAMGAVEFVGVARETNLVSALEKIKESGIWVYGAATDGGLAPWSVDLKGPLCLVLGSEGEGLRSLVARTCDVIVSIPMRGGVGSLNVAAAGAALCYEVARQRAQHPETP